MPRRVPLLALVAVCACAPPSGPAIAPPVASPLAGRVVDALSGAPVAGAEVERGDARAVTDRDGRFALGGATGPTRARAAGYLGLTRLRLEGAAPIELALWPADPDDAAVEAHLARLEVGRALRDDPADPALRPEARAWILGEAVEPEPGAVGRATAALSAAPTTIRIWRRSIDGATASCSGRVDVMDFEDYIRGVLPHEWIASWHDESLRAGALSIRTYAWGWIARGGKYDCADLDDTARSQVYRDDRTARATMAVDDTRGEAITQDGVLVSGEYSAENGDPTAAGVADPLCRGFEIRGHRRGMCQWGSQRWARDEGRDHVWIAEHYWPGGAIERAEEPGTAYDAALVAVEAPAEARPGELVPVTVVMENLGTRTWMEQVALTALDPALRAPGWIDEATVVRGAPMVVETGELARFSFEVLAPATTGEVSARFQLAPEGEAAFGPAVALSLSVTDGAALADAGGGADAGPERGDAGEASGELRGGCAVRPTRHAGAWLGWLGLAVVVFGARRRFGG